MRDYGEHFSLPINILWESYLLKNDFISSVGCAISAYEERAVCAAAVYSCVRGKDYDMGIKEMSKFCNIKIETIELLCDKMGKRGEFDFEKTME